MAGPSIKRRKEGVATKEVRSLCTCLLALMDDVEDLFALNLDADKRTILRRVDAEGFGFLAKRLPEFQKWILESVRSEQLQTPMPRFKAGRDAARPAFLQKLTYQLFDGTGKYIKPATEEQREYQAEVLRSINFICTSFGKKYEAPLTDKEHDDQIRKYLAFDEEQCLDPVTEWSSLSSEAKRTVRGARQLLSELFSDYQVQAVVGGVYRTITRSFWTTDLKFGFGPGAVLEKYDAYEKYVRFKTPPLCAIGPLGLWEVFTPSPGSSSPDNIVDFSRLTELEKDAWLSAAAGRGISRLALVAKTAGVGRIVLLQGNELMYCQQAYKDRFYTWIEEHPLTRGQVNFTNQQINRDAALEGSRTGLKATLDESSASDTVSMGHVEAYFPLKIAGVLRHLRTRRVMTKFRNGTEICKFDIHMHAPMGSALCFPIEALVFWATAKAVLRSAGLPDEVLVYGDDVIVSVEGYELVSRTFSELGFIVNQSKSYSKGPFRESCGMDALNGAPCNAPFKVKKRVPFLGIGVRREDRDRAVAAWITYANDAERNGYPTLAKALRYTLISAYPKAESFPVTSDITEVTEGYLAFLDYACKRTVRGVKTNYPTSGCGRPQPDKRYTEFQKSEPAIWYGRPSSIFEPGLMGPFQEDSLEESRAIRLHNAGTYKAARVGAPRHHEVATKKLYVSGTRGAEQQLPETTAYLRWVLEHPENSREIPGDEFHISRRRVTLS